jgi:hypothetical protein
MRMMIYFCWEFSLYLCWSWPVHHLITDAGFTSIRAGFIGFTGFTGYSGALSPGIGDL